MFMRTCRGIIACAVVAACVVLLCPRLPAAIDEKTVTAIEITGNRVYDSIIRRNLAFSEGDILDERKIEKSLAKLYALGLFKSLDITPERDSVSGGTKVVVSAVDGWYIFPLPMFGSRGGERYVAGMLLEQNYFRGAERIMLFGNYGDKVSLNAVSIMLPALTIRAALERRSYTEYGYADGGYTAQPIPDDKIGELTRYGQVANSYDREATALRLSAALPLSEKIQGTFAANMSELQYSPVSGSAPVDKGKVNTLMLSVAYGHPDVTGDILSGFSRIFGLGMADMKEKLKPLARAYTEHGLQTGLETSAAVFGSESEFCKLTVAASRMTLYRDRSTLLFSLKGGYGVNVPFGQLFATSRRDGLIGVYAREYRGDRLLSAGSSYRHPFLRNGLGQLYGELFAEYAAAFLDSNRYDREGAGLRMTYAFWRFPLPLGFGYTYSFDDNDWQASIAFGGMF
jgi:outer membrane protein assembly factor BamA